jgi:CheY-like chemotaxis protein
MLPPVLDSGGYAGVGELMKMAVFSRWVKPWGGLTLVAFIIAGCAEQAPQIRVIEQLPQGTDPIIFVTAARQKDEIVKALRAAGFHLVDTPVDGAYLLRVTVGIDQGSQACGTLNNVRYVLRSEKRDIIEAVAKGWTGACMPNVYDTVSRELRQRLVQARGEGHQ